MKMVDFEMANRRPTQFLAPSENGKKLTGSVREFSWVYSDERGDGGGDGVGDDGTTAVLLLLGTLVPLLSSS